VPKPVLHLDCCVLSDEEVQSLCEHLSAQTGVTEIGIQTFWMSVEEEDDENPLILNISVTPAHWSSIVAASSDPHEAAAKWLIKLLYVWAEDKRDLVVGYDEKQNIVILGNPEEWEPIL
jgi:hypothetical protein